MENTNQVQHKNSSNDQAVQSNGASLGRGPSREPLSNELIVKLERLRVGVRQLPATIKQYFDVAPEQINDDKVMQFELFNLSPLETLFNEVKALLTKELIDQNKCCMASERSEFYEVLGGDLLPLLIVSKFDLSHLCLIGFDITVLSRDMQMGPYEAILDLVNRLNGFAEQLLALAFLPRFQEIVKDGRPDKLLCFRQGNDYFKVYSACYHLDLSLYMLGEYMKKATKALDRRTKEIIFTGCYSLFERLIPVLVRLELHRLLAVAAETNLELLSSHANFDYFQFFAKVPVEPKFEYLFATIQTVLNKSLLSYTLTPFIFGLLRNYQLFDNFLRSINHECWVKYAKAAVQGLVIVIKSGSLRFSEVMDLLDLTVSCTCLSNDIYKTAIECLTKPNAPEWHEVDSFFRSSIKAGYNSGIYAIVHKLEDIEVENRLKNALVMGLISLKDSSDVQSVQQWLTTIEVRREAQEQLLNGLLEKHMKILDPQFSLLGIGSVNRGYKQSEAFKNNTSREKHLTVLRVLNTLRILHQCCQKNYLEMESFRQYLLAILTTICESCPTPPCQQLAEYVLATGHSNHQTLSNSLDVIQRLQLSEKFLTAYMQRASSESSKEEYIRDLIEYILVLLKKETLTNQTLAHIERMTFQPLASLNKRYLKFNFGGVSVPDIPAALSFATSFYSQIELIRIIESLYTVDVASNTLLANPITLVDLVEPTTIKTLNEEIVTDMLFVQLTPTVRQLLSSLIDNLISSYTEKAPNDLTKRSFELLNYFSARYPIVDYYILNYSPSILPIQGLLNELNLPEYMHFGYVLAKLGQNDPLALSLLLRLLKNRAIVTREGQSLIRKIVLPNVLNVLTKSIQSASKFLDKLSCLRLLNILDALACEYCSERSIKLALTGVISLIRSEAKDYQGEHLAELLVLFDKFVKADLGSEYSSLRQELRREAERYTFSQSAEKTPPVEFQHHEVVVLNDPLAKAPQEKYMAALKKESVQKEPTAYSINPTTLKLVVKPQKDRSPTKSIPSQSVRTHDYDQLSDILAGQPQTLSQEQDVHQYSAYRYPKLNVKQLCTCLQLYFAGKEQTVKIAILNAENCAIVLVLVVELYLYGGSNPKNIIALKDIQTDLLNEMCINLLQPIGFVRVLNCKVDDLHKSPIERSAFYEHPANRDASLLNLFLKKLLQEKSADLIRNYLSNFLSEDILKLSQELLYNTSLDSETINLIQKKLPVEGVMSLSLLIHSNPSTLRSYFSSLIEGMALMNLPSRLLNYHEYIKLTGEWQSDTEFLQLFEIYKLNWSFYLKVLAERRTISRREARLGLQYKLTAERPKDQIVKEYKNEIETSDANLLSTFAEIVSKSNLADALRRHSDLYRTLLQMKAANKIIQADIYQFDIVPIFKELCRLFDRGVVLPNFIVYNRYASQQLADIDLPKFIEFWEDTVGVASQPQRSEDKHPSEIVRVQLSTIADLPSPCPFVHRRFEIVVEGKPEAEQLVWRRQLELMQKSGLVVNDKGSLVFQPCSEEQCREFRMLGAIYGCLLMKNKQCSERFCHQLVYYIRRQRLSWTLIESIDKEAYTTIIDLLGRPTVKDMNLTFAYDKEDLIPRGSQKRVTDFNRKQYCNLLALSRLPSTRLQSQEFMNGFASVVHWDKLPAQLLPQ